MQEMTKIKVDFKWAAKVLSFLRLH